MIWKRKSPVEALEGAAAAVPEPAAAIPVLPDPVAIPAAGSEFLPLRSDNIWREAVPAETGPTLPRFMSSAADDLETEMAGRAARRRLALRDALAASQPVVGRENFAGRHDPMGRLINAIEEQRVHVVIYGERGMGKTSLAHVFAETAREARYLVIYASCGTATNFSEIFRSIVARIPRIYHSEVLPNSPEAESDDCFDIMLPPGPFGARELADVLSGVMGTRVLIVLDEYDRVIDVNFRREVAELIKNLSDRAARVQLIITGVALNLDELIGYAPSIRRNIVGLPITGMSIDEMRDLLRLGERAADIHFSDESVAHIAAMAGGSPYLVRLLGHQSSLLALDDGRDRVTEADARTAVDMVLRDWQASLPRRVQANLARPETREHWQLLVSAARAGNSADGWFTVDDVYAETGGSISQLNIERDLKLFVNTIDLLDRREGPSDPHFRFSYPGVASLLMMSAAITRLAN